LSEAEKKEKLALEKKLSEMEEELKVKQIDKPMHFGHQAFNVDQLNPTFYEFAFIFFYFFISNVLYWFFDFFRNNLSIYYTFIAFKKDLNSWWLLSVIFSICFQAIRTVI
jgi:hypothetical protein